MICGNTASTVWRDQKTCSSDCRRKLKRQRANERNRRYTASDGFMDARTPNRRIWVVNCAECGKLFVARAANQLRCGIECHRVAHSRVVSEAIMRRYRQDPAFRDLVISKAQNRRASRLGHEGITTPAALIAYLMDRDHGRCGKCHQPIKAKTGPRRPSIGHIIPLARGGEHVLENVQAEHLDCNLRAGARDHGGQGLLVG